MQEEKLRICKNLQKALDESGLSRAELSRAADVTEASISRYLSGKAEPRTAELIRISGVLGKTIDWMCGVSAEQETVRGDRVAEPKVDYRNVTPGGKIVDYRELVESIVEFGPPESIHAILKAMGEQVASGNSKAAIDAGDFIRLIRERRPEVFDN